MTVIGCIYAMLDPGCPGLTKVGKDQKWPQRFRLAQSHTPRGMIELGRWNIRGDRSTLAKAEGRALALLPREASCPGREWVRASSEQITGYLTDLFGAREPLTDIIDLIGLGPFDDWRDRPRPRNSRKPRRIWIGEEKETGRLKIVHSPHIEKFDTLCPTYNRYGIDWLEAWGWPAETWTASDCLSDRDNQLITLWAEMVSDLGYGASDLRLGWLRDGTNVQVVRERLRDIGLLDSHKKGRRYHVAETMAPQTGKSALTAD